MYPDTRTHRHINTMTQPAWPRASRSKNPNVNHIKFAKVHKSLFPFFWIKYYCFRDSSLKSLVPSELASLTPAGPGFSSSQGQTMTEDTLAQTCCFLYNVKDLQTVCMMTTTLGSGAMPMKVSFLALQSVMLWEGPASQPQSTLSRWKNLPPLIQNSDPP